MQDIAVNGDNIYMTIISVVNFMEDTKNWL